MTTQPIRAPKHGDKKTGTRRRSILHRNFFLLLFLLSLISTSANAGVKIYYRNSVKSKNLPGQLGVKNFNSNSNKKLNIGLINKETLNFLKAQKKSIPGLQSKYSKLNLQKSQKGKFGITLRYRQKFKRVSIEGAELIAIYNKKGALQTINSSLINVPDKFNIEPKISKKSALAKAVRFSKIKHVSLGRSANDGLLIVANRSKKALSLVWQFHIREKKSGNKAALIQVIAAGKNTGQIYRNLKASHSAVNNSTTKVDIFDATKEIKAIEKDKALVSPSEIHSDVDDAFSNIKHALEFYEDQFGRKSFDNKGTLVTAYVRLQEPNLIQNAAWISAWSTFVFGAGGETLANLPGSLDVVGHELTHGVITHSSNLLYQKESGALNEHFADVFGEMIEVFYGKNNGDFLIGENAMGPGTTAKSLRNMKSPHDALAKQPADMSEYPKEFGEACVPSKENDNCGVHVLSGILNKVAYQIISEIGFKNSQNLFYRVMTERLTSDATFVDYKNQMLDECNLSAKPACSVIAKAFAQSGI